MNWWRWERKFLKITVYSYYIIYYMIWINDWILLRLESPTRLTFIVMSTFCFLLLVISPHSSFPRTSHSQSKSKETSACDISSRIHDTTMRHSYKKISKREEYRQVWVSHQTHLYHDLNFLLLLSRDFSPLFLPFYFFHSQDKSKETPVVFILIFICL